ncbi:MAG: DUF2802 domain-containing protein [Gammaproteobacteria bacterium HGW-Gammaproteobacteria-3]|nr:MAG: DUF2802 domain-containing protein [Gammaproteobacteria bacterium HGW-Gammaproteobacteria-3]
MSDYLLTGFAALMVMLVLVVWLLIDHIRLKRRYRILAEHVNNHNRDIAGLCTAAVTVDSRLSGADDVLQSLSAKLADYDIREELEQIVREDKPESGDDAEPSYQNAIARARAGADAAELMQRFGLSRDEAALLIRLHGINSRP